MKNIMWKYFTANNTPWESRFREPITSKSLNRVCRESTVSSECSRGGKTSACQVERFQQCVQFVDTTNRP